MNSYDDCDDGDSDDDVDGDEDGNADDVVDDAHHDYVCFFKQKKANLCFKKARLIIFASNLGSLVLDFLNDLCNNKCFFFEM